MREERSPAVRRGKGAHGRLPERRGRAVRGHWQRSTSRAGIRPAVAVSMSRAALEGMRPRRFQLDSTCGLRFSALAAATWLPPK